MNLRDTLLAALANLPGTREFHLHVLVTSPRKHSALFPFAHPRPRSYLQDIVVLLSEQASTLDAPHIFVAAIEASLYNIPTTSSAILYISKVDTTGQGITPTPTANLIRALLTYYADPKTRPFVADHLWIHLFARAQGQYLFPNSAEFNGKHPLNGVKLCAWWKRALSDVAGELERRIGGSKAKIRLYYILPGSSEMEASHSLNFASTLTTPSTAQWTYGHPYSQSEIPSPCPPSDKPNLGHYIPSFDDDPKSRFIDEIAYTTDADGVKSPERKRPRKDSSWEKDAGRKGVEKEEPLHVGDERVQGELNKVTTDEFWERMSFRQECIAGTLTGFFTMGVSCPCSNNSRSEISPLAPQPGQVSSQMTKRILSSLLTAHEFSTIERSVRATGIMEAAIKGLCDGLKTAQPSTSASLPVSSQPSIDRPSTPEPEPKPQLLAPPQTPPPRLKNGKRIIPDVSPNPFPEPVTSLETYYSHIYGSVQVDNPPLPAKKASGTEGPTPQVTVLTVRKKKKRV